MGQSNFTNTIYKLRKQAGYTQADVSRRLNIQRQTYCNYENALRTPPLEIIVALADLYQVSVDYLVRGCDSADAASSAVRLNDSEKKLIADFSALEQHSQKEVLNFIQFKKQFSD